MKNFREFIAEKHTSTLYHATAGHAGIPILADKKLIGREMKYSEALLSARLFGFKPHLTFDVLHQAEEARKWLVERGYTHYISFARAADNTFTRTVLSSRDNVIIFKLNGRKIAQHGKIISADYFGTRGRGPGEVEDRLLISRKGDVINISNAILDVAVFTEDDSIKAKMEQMWPNYKNFGVFNPDANADEANINIPASLEKMRKARF
jgi:hypothetical protein